MPPPSNPAIRMLPPTPRTVLVVDDDPAHRRACERILKHAGYGVISASNGASAMRTLLSSPVDVLLLDIFMPEKDGFETMLSLRKVNAKTPIIVMSGGGRVTPASDVLEQCRKLGAKAVLGKPFTDVELLAAVAECLGEKATRD